MIVVPLILSPADMGIMAYESALYNVYIVMNSPNDTSVNVAISLHNAWPGMNDRPNHPTTKWLVMQ